MAGRIKVLIGELMDKRAKGNEAMQHFLRSHLILRGIHPDAYKEDTADDPSVVQTLEQMLKEHR